ncbi:hypothetical protein SDC9_41450 [bioreactor metagenome]|uniref:Uncharacterized protein n=1 Tax=bioreactor metagenome TaxID=1076179 RepID=A0A644VVN1_9ZZZZ
MGVKQGQDFFHVPVIDDQDDPPVSVPEFLELLLSDEPEGVLFLFRPELELPEVIDEDNALLQVEGKSLVVVAVLGDHVAGAAEFRHRSGELSCGEQAVIKGKHPLE